VIHSADRVLFEAINRLQLPIDPKFDSLALERTKELAVRKNWSQSDAAVLLDEALDDWDTTGRGTPGAWRSAER
jgi:hypothetical protein